ncbi:hypothetical protein LGN19_35740 [Burkholderia sp. AU30198]|uniref:hypothetical protein n=1 Tax=Burkholderia sp. AU30198 TaxID=2879627 RepID=UPI001CF44967|nr:hypothetical protein [Burkholderia sp. AU30198]MCA8299143.1 hypothetical protein [Burkholderia sp. AU30198]
MRQHIIDAIADAWNIRPTSVLKLAGSPVCGARWLCRSRPGDRAYETPLLANTHVISLMLSSFSGECLLDGRDFFTGKVPTHRLRVPPSGHAIARDISRDALQALGNTGSLAVTAYRRTPPIFPFIPTMLRRDIDARDSR